MRLKSLEIHGYKSFANKVQIVFDGGLTAVVGPNGSGKSNVVDAIRWVLGEQSYVNLRGRKTTDMIFSGSDGRARLSMAVVTLLLDNTDKWLPLDFSEVSISRRAYRSGENEYYLNGTKVRLREVAELLAQGGLSRQTYTVIGQGTIDRVLSLHSGERRRLFEEAAGIVFHRQKRAETFERLEATQANLIRLNDLVQEIEPRLKRLEKQAERAEAHAGIMQSLTGLLTIWYGYRWQEAKKQQYQANLALQASEAACKVQQGKLSEVEVKVTSLRANQTVQRQRLGEIYAESGQLSKQAETVQRELAVNSERARQFEAQRQEIVADLELLERNLQSQHGQSIETEAKLTQLTQELRQAEVEFAATQQQLNSYQARQQETLNRQAETERHRQTLTTDLTKRQAELNQLLQRQNTLQHEQTQHVAEMAHLTAQKSTLQAEYSQIEAKLQALSGEVTALEAERVTKTTELSQLNSQLERLQVELVPLTRQQESLKTRQEVLGRLRTDMEGYHEGVREVLRPKNGLSGIIGTVSQLIQVPPDLEIAIEVALGGRLQDVVVENFHDAQKAIAYLKGQQLGRATFLPLETLRVPSPAQLPDSPGVVGLASELVMVTTKLQVLANFALNRTVIVVDLPSARLAFDLMRGGFNLVTRDGELMGSSGAVTGGRERQQKGPRHTFLAREREWRELPERLAELQRQGEVVLQQISHYRQQIAAQEQAIQQVTDLRRDKNLQRRKLQDEADKVSRAAEKVASNLGWQMDLQAKATAELQRLAHRQAEIETEMHGLETARQTVEMELQQLAAQFDSLVATDLVAAVNLAQTELATLRERQQKEQAILTGHNAMRQQLQQQVVGKQNREKLLLTEQATLHAQQTILETRHAALQGELSGYSRQIEAIEAAVHELELNIASHEQVARDLRYQAQQLEANLRQVSLKAARAQDDVANLARQMEDELGLMQLELAEANRPDEAAEAAETKPLLVISPDDLPLVEKLPEGLEEDIKQARLKLRRLGTVNPEAPREYAELNERYSFLTTQIGDLETAAQNLKEVITKLDALMYESFVATFQQVSVEFKKYFKAMFGGGEANIILTDPDDLTNSGVDIIARPPGKRLQSMALLSGGERSLTAQALIFALLKISPTPFVIFDEVDAMLDEANVGRFRDALVGLSNEIQFIVVTHNRKTVEAANTIYGVSMGADSVSQVYSLKLNEWEEQVKGKG